MSVGDGMRLLMHQSGLNATDMARKLQVTRFTVGGWLNDRRPPSTPVLMAWAMVTGGSWEWLCAIRDSNPEPADYVPAFLLPVMRAA
jgi:transcriptional regulator with XRE-family HTH domain